MESKNQTPCTIREAKRDDFEWVSDLMDVALAPYYGGDHRAHAQRIFSTHISGGIDRIGHFSHEQKMYIAEVNGERAGMIHLVGKRQETYKISPLIVAPAYQGNKGIGSALLAFAEDYAREREARQMYCTVAEKNSNALQFFKRKKYVVAGSSDSHYKVGSREYMLYKPFGSEAIARKRDEIDISVLPFEEKYRDGAAALIHRTLPQWFGGVDEKWVESLFEGYRRRSSGNINEKFKLIYLAIDRQEHVLGIVGATPKKGQPIKLMPFIAETEPAFEALLHDVPFMLAPYGHKLYTHLHPTVEQVMALQKLGWKIDAVMPGAYRSEVITQQWGCSLEGTTMRDMRVKKRFFDYIKSGRKDLEVRVGYNSIKTIRPGESINLTTHDEDMVIKVNQIRIYRTFADMLKTEKADRIAPGSNQEQTQALLERIYPPEKERLGVYVLEIGLQDRA